MVKYGQSDVLKDHHLPGWGAAGLAQDFVPGWKFPVCLEASEHDIRFSHS